MHSNDRTDIPTLEPMSHTVLSPRCDWKISARRSVLTVLCALVASPLWGQIVEKKTADEPAITLSPFVVDAAKDVGYAAQNTLSGTRTNSALKDIASAVGVFTQEFIRDLGATNETDIMAYSAFAVPELTEQTANLQGIGLIQPGVFKYRIRGQAASRTRNYFNTLIPGDTYNIERFDEARGPNAILFGLGGAGGIQNQTTKRAEPSRPRTELVATVGSDELIRGELDHNQVLRAKTMAVRFNGMAQNSAGWRPYEFNRERRGHLAGTFVVNPKMKLNLEFEAGSIHDTASRDFGANDYVSLWLDKGRTTTPLKTANAALGIGLTANQQRVTVVGNDSTVRNFQQAPVSTTDAARLGGAIIDPSLVPFNAFMPGPGSERLIYRQPVVLGPGGPRHPVAVAHLQPVAKCAGARQPDRPHSRQ
jgi:outer membrane receptor protein involved in Fe transport